MHEYSTSFQAARGVHRWVHECSTSFRAARGVYRWVHEWSTSFLAARGVYRWVHEWSTSFLVARGVYRWVHEWSTSFLAARGVYRWVHKCNTSFEGRTGPYPVNLRAQYRRCMSSTPETGHLACTSVVPRFGPHGAYTVGYTRAVSRFKAARGRIPLICARSIDAVSHRRPRQEV